MPVASTRGSFHRFWLDQPARLVAEPPFRLHVAGVGDRPRPLDLAGGPQLSEQESVQTLPHTGFLPLDHPPNDGIAGLVRALALEVAGSGVTVNAVAPGVIETPQSADPVNSLGPDGLERFARKVPVGRNGRPEDVAALFLYLASEEAGFLTGQTILIDGGVSLSLSY